MKLSDWLTHQDYDKGVALYQELVPGAPLLSLFRIGQNSFTEKKLFEELSKLRPLPDEAQQRSGTPKLVAQNPEVPGQAREQQAPDWTEDQRRMFRERATAHAQMKSATNASDRKALAFRILAITDRIEKTLKGPEVDDSLTDDPVELIKLRNNNRAYISKFKDHENRQIEVQRRRRQNEIIEGKLG